MLAHKKDHMVPFRADETEKALLNLMAADQGVTVSDVLRSMLQREFKVWIQERNPRPRAAMGSAEQMG